MFVLPEFFQLLQQCLDNVVLLTYDTTFHLGDFYVTILVLQLGAFSECLLVPIAFMLHERNIQRTHSDFCDSISKFLSASAKSRPLHVCTDSESGCSNALQQTFPNWIILNCWNHIIGDVEC